MIYNKLTTLYIAQCGQLECEIINATNNLMKTDFSFRAYEELVKAKAVEEWHRIYFKGILDYVKSLEDIT